MPTYHVFEVPTIKVESIEKSGSDPILLDTIQIPEGAGAGKVLCSDENGVASWGDYGTAGTFGEETFSHQFTAVPETSYSVRAFAINSYGVGYGETVLITTPELGIPVLITYDSTAITQFSFEANGEIIDTGTTGITTRGFCYIESLLGVPTINDLVKSEDAEVTINTFFDEECNDLNNWTYSGNPEINPSGQMHFLSNANSIEMSTQPVSESFSGFTIEIKIYFNSLGSFDSGNNVNCFFFGVMFDSSVFYGIFSSEGVLTFNGQEFSQFGTVIPSYGGNAEWETWKFVITPNESNSRMELFLDESGTYISKGSVDVPFSSIGTSYQIYMGNISSTEIVEIHLDFFKLNKEIVQPFEIGNYHLSITDLEQNTNYRVRSFAINSNGIGYGNTIDVLTEGIKAPTVSTYPVTLITDFSCRAHGEVINDFGSEITTRGFCYFEGTENDPTIYDSTASEDISIIGSYSLTINNLKNNTNYRLRAYSINSAGVGYGNTIDLLTTIAELPEVITYDSTTITDCSFIAEGELLNSGSELIISPNPPENITGVEIWNANTIGSSELKYIIIPEINATKYPNSLLLYSYPVTITWNSNDAEYITLSDDQGNVETLPSLSGSIEKTQIEKKVYTLTAYNGPQTATAEIQISAFVNKYEDSFQVNPPGIEGGAFGVSSPTFSTVPKYVFIYQLPVILSINHEVSSRVELYYTINNGTPTKDSTLYTSVLSITEDYFDTTSLPEICIIKAIAYAPITGTYSPESTKEIILLRNSGPTGDGEILAGDGEINLTGVEIVSGAFYETIIVWPNDIIDTDTTSSETIQITGVEIVSGAFYETIIVWPNDIIDTDTTSSETIQITGVEIVSGEWWQSVIEV